MNNRKTIAVLCMMMLIIFASLVPVNAASINKKSVALTVGKTTTLKIKGTHSRVTWSSSNKSVATVTSKGKVKGIKGGKKATITARVNGKKYKCTVKVKKLTNNQVNNAMNKYYDKKMANQGGPAWITESKKPTSKYAYYFARYGTGAKRDLKVNKYTGKVYGTAYYMVERGDMKPDHGYKYTFHLSKYY